MKRHLGLIFTVFVILFVLSCIGFVVPLDFVFQLVFGWIVFLMRVVPEITVGWDGVLTAVVCVVLFTVGLHYLLHWFFVQMQQAKDVDKEAVRPWRVRWTGSIVGVVVLMFVSGIAAVGISHQTGWLLTSPEPLTRGSIREAAAPMQSANNLKSMALASHSHHDDIGHLPPGARFDAQGRALHGWQTLLLPFIEEDNVYNQINFDLPWNHADNAPAFQTRVHTYQHPRIDEQENEQGFALSHYAGNVHVLGRDKPLKFAEITDGTSNTILFGEIAGNFRPWGYPLNWRDPAKGLNTHPDGFGSPNPQRGVQFGFADGSARTLTSKVSPAVLKALSTPDGGEEIPAGDY